MEVGDRLQVLSLPQPDASPLKLEQSLSYANNLKSIAIAEKGGSFLLRVAQQRCMNCCCQSGIRVVLLRSVRPEAGAGESSPHVSRVLYRASRVPASTSTSKALTFSRLESSFI